MMKGYGSTGEKIYRRLRIFCPVCGTKNLLGMGERVLCSGCLENGVPTMLGIAGKMDKKHITVKAETSVIDLPSVNAGKGRSKIEDYLDLKDVASTDLGRLPGGQGGSEDGS